MKQTVEDLPTVEDINFILALLSDPETVHHKPIDDKILDTILDRLRALKKIWTSKGVEVSEVDLVFEDPYDGVDQTNIHTFKAGDWYRGNASMGTPFRIVRVTASLKRLKT